MSLARQSAMMSGVWTGLIIAAGLGTLALAVLLVLGQRAGLGRRELRAIAGDPRVPRWLKAMFVLALLPIPGPFDEFVGGVAVLLLMRRLPDVVGQHRRRRDRQGSGS